MNEIGSKRRKLMGFSKEKIRQICLLMTFAAVLVLTVMYSDVIFRAIGLAFSIASPFLIGGVIAFVLNLPMKFIEGKLLAKWKGKVAEKLKRTVSILLSIVFLVLIINVVVITVVPQITAAANVLGQKIPGFLDKVVVELEKLSKEYPQLQEQVATLEQMEINWDSIANTVINFLKNGVGSMLTSTFSVASGIIGGVVNFVISFIFLTKVSKCAFPPLLALLLNCPFSIKQSFLKIPHFVYVPPKSQLKIHIN